MLLTEYDEAEFIKLTREEGRHEGRAEGREEGLEEGLKKGRANGIKEGRIMSFSELVKDGLFPLSEAARRLNLSVSEFTRRAKELGYTLSEKQGGYVV